jgi:hypothetical protein
VESVLRLVKFIYFVMIFVPKVSEILNVINDDFSCL